MLARIRMLVAWLVAATVIGCSGCGRPEKSTQNGAPPPADVHGPSQPAVETADASQRSPAPPGKKRLIWLALDGLDWEHLTGLANAGKLPNWKRLADEGFGARLETFEPMLSPLLWTTQETGVGPDVHRVLDFQEVDSKTGVLGPVSENSRKVPAIWNAISARGGRVGVVGFWATHPAEVVNGFFLSNRIDASKPDQVPGGVGSPPSLDETVRKIVARDGEVPREDLAPFWNVPPAALEAAFSKGQGYDNPITALAELLGTTRVTQRLARELYDRELPELMAVYFEGTDSIGHLFGRYAPPRLPCVAEAEFAAFERVPETYFGVVDRILGQWMRRAREDGAVLVVTSDHGFRWAAGRPCESGTESATAAAWHRTPGVFVAWGSGVAAKPAVSTSATEFDVAPTLLALLGSPADVRMKGRVLPVTPGLPAERKDLFGGLAVSRVAAQPLDPKSASEYAKRLAALGYISPTNSAEATASPKSEAGLTKGAWNNLGVYLRYSAGNARGAREAWLHAIELDPSYRSPLVNLARLAADKGDFADASRWVLRAAAAGGAGENPVLSFAAEISRRDPAAGVALLRRAHEGAPGDEVYAREYALVLTKTGKCREAERVSAPLERSSSAASLNAAAVVATCLDDPQRVREILTRSLAVDPNQPLVRDALQSLPR